MIYALFILETFVAALSWLIYAVTGCLSGAVVFGLVMGATVFVNWWLCWSAASASCEEE